MLPVRWTGLGNTRSHRAAGEGSCIVNVPRASRDSGLRGRTRLAARPSRRPWPRLPVPARGPNVVCGEWHRRNLPSPLDGFCKDALVPSAGARAAPWAYPCPLRDVATQHADILVVYDDLLLHAEGAYPPARWVEAASSSAAAGAAPRSSARSRPGRAPARSWPRRPSARSRPRIPAARRCRWWSGLISSCCHNANGPPRCSWYPKC